MSVRSVARSSTPVPHAQTVGARLLRYLPLFADVVVAGALLVAVGLLLLDRTLPEYVDESDNLLGGQLMTRGLRLYVDYFSQHMPVPYLFASVATWFGARDLVAYRTAFIVLVGVVLALTAFHLRRRLSPVLLACVFVSFGVAHPIFNGYMVLADHFFAVSLLVIALLFLANDVDFSVPEQIALSVCFFVALQSTLISIYPIAWLAAYYALRRITSRCTGWRYELRFIALIATPHILLLLYLVQRGMLGDLFDQAFAFNQRYYSHYDIGTDPLNILRTSMADLYGMVMRYLRPGDWREVETVLLLSNIFAVVLLWRRRAWLFGVFYAGLVVFSRMRGPGYHGSPYFAISFLSMAILVAWAVDVLVQLWRVRRAASARWLGAVCATTYAAYFVLFVHDIGGFYLRLPRAQDLRSPYTDAVLANSRADEPIWGAPNEPYLYLETGRLPASRYAYYQPWLADSPTIRSRVLDDLRRTRPPVIVFESDKHIAWNFPLPTPAEYAAPVSALLSEQYTPLDPGDPILKNVYVRRDRRV